MMFHAPWCSIYRAHAVHLLWLTRDSATKNNGPTSAPPPKSTHDPGGKLDNGCPIIARTTRNSDITAPLIMAAPANGRPVRSQQGSALRDSWMAKAPQRMSAPAGCGTGLVNTKNAIPRSHAVQGWCHCYSPCVCLKDNHKTPGNEEHDPAE
jgi:hypothetical protein